jgi:gliding motility-associated-like protein
MFYSNGQRVWNRNDVMMPNGSALLGDNTGGSMAVLIVPYISDTNKYYLFTIDTWGPLQTVYLSYTTIDMTLNGGLGDVVAGQKNIVLDSGMAEQMTAIKGAGCYVWLVAHRQYAQFDAYKISLGGISTQPVVSAVGFLTGPADYRSGAMAASDDGKKIALGNENVPVLELHNFDRLTGKVSNGFLLQTNTRQAKVTEVCFRNNANELYTLGDSFLVCYVPLVIPANFKQAFSISSNTGLRKCPLPDNDICVTGDVPFLKTSLSKIRPIKNGLVLLNPSSIKFPPGKLLTGRLGTDVVEIYDTSQALVPDTGICPGQLLAIDAPEGYNSYTWSTGAVTTGIQLSAPGKYWVKVESETCGSYTDTFTVANDNIPVPPFTVADTALCPGEVYTVKAPAGFPKYAWSTGANTEYDTIKTYGKHWAEIGNKCGVRSSDTFTIKDKYIPIPLFDIDDTVLCPGATYAAVVPQGTLHYLWSTGSKLPASILSKQGMYWVKVMNDCNESATDSFTLSPPKDVYFDIADTAGCSGEMITIAGPLGYSKYMWSTGENSTLVTARQGGQYWLALTNECNTSYTDSFKIEDLNNRVLKPVLGNDTFNCMYDRLVPLTMDVDTKDTTVLVLWSTGDTGNRIIAELPGTYWVSFFNQCTSRADTINLLGCPPKEIDSIWIPNAFTPNGDGLNDVFRIPFPKYQVVSVDLRIYGRFGNEVCRITDVKGGWDGGKCDLGVYFYFLRYKDVTGKEHFQKGDITLMR